MLVLVLDPAALALSYYLAYAFRFATDIPTSDKALLWSSMPLVVVVKLLALWICKTFRHSWWRGSINDIYRLGVATILGEVVSVTAVTGIYRFVGYSRAVFLADAFITWLLLVGVRQSFPLFRDSIYHWRTTTISPRRVFLLGTSEHADMALRFLRGKKIECAGLIDTNGGADLHRYVFGRPVLGRLDDLTWLAVHHGISEVVLPEGEAIPISPADFENYCQRSQLRLTRLGFYSHWTQ